MYSYKYRDKIYNSIDTLRQAVFKQEGKVFGKTLTENYMNILGIEKVETDSIKTTFKSVDLLLLKQSKKLEELDNKYKNATYNRNAKFTSSLGFTIRVDDNSMRYWQALFTLKEYGFTDLGFFDEHHTWKPLTADMLDVIKLEIAQYVFNNTITYRDKRSEVKNLIDTAAVDIVDTDIFV